MLAQLNKMKDGYEDRKVNPIWLVRAGGPEGSKPCQNLSQESLTSNPACCRSCRRPASRALSHACPGSKRLSSTVAAPWKQRRGALRSPAAAACRGLLPPAAAAAAAAAAVAAAAAAVTLSRNRDSISLLLRLRRIPAAAAAGPAALLPHDQQELSRVFCQRRPEEIT
jgi:hypothetical protein